MRSPLRDIGVIEVSTYPSSGHLRSGEIVLRCSDIPGQQLLDAVDRVIGDLFEHAAEVEFRIKPVQFRRSQQRIDRGCSFATRIGPTEQEILPAQGDNAQSPLGSRVVCALIRCIFLPGANPGRQTLAPAGNTRGGSRGDE
jgi:hypothetical protein